MEKRFRSKSRGLQAQLLLPHCGYLDAPYKKKLLVSRPSCTPQTATSYRPAPSRDAHPKGIPNPCQSVCQDAFTTLSLWTNMNAARKRRPGRGSMAVISLKTLGAASIERKARCLLVSKMKNNRVRSRKTGIQIDGQSGRKEMVEIGDSRKTGASLFVSRSDQSASEWMKTDANAKWKDRNNANRFISALLWSFSFFSPLRFKALFGYLGFSHFSPDWQLFAGSKL